ncbi:R-spondin-1 isoform X1 [Protopterus annectens]|uniref:R-spondin-1 isoform X1 n=1 Tax=Protopterus annectens TaxID=7888 RepID=UPI001CFA15B3|nr:R-spondin-1 isoform X1 [Protopterus annectens]XP_043939678.1 R-spondin-1 isoform X1 [Protopterus annectens]XP_043939686.1 R-spondin-1 isoform X1 [Protopterus annectens]
MQFGLIVVVVFLSLMDYTGSRKDISEKRQKWKSTDMTPVCATGCDMCSEYNGCLRCSPKLFILLERSDIRQIGICLPACPEGYFGFRTPDMNKCITVHSKYCLTHILASLTQDEGRLRVRQYSNYRSHSKQNGCKIDNCEACFSRNFCTKCKEGLYLHKGKCYSTCPDGFIAVNDTMECNSPAQCEMSEWGPWSPCSKRKKQCGFKKGTEERTRTVLQAPSGDMSLCPPTTESRKCTVQKKPCSKDDKEKGSKKGKKEDGKKETRNNGDNKSKKDTKEGRQGKKKKGQQQGTVAPTVTSLPVQ